MYFMKFKNRDTMIRAIIVFTETVENLLAPTEFIPTATRSVMAIHFPATTDVSEIADIFNDEEALSEISIINEDTNETWMHFDYVIPLSLNLQNYGNETDALMYGQKRWIMELAKLTDADKKFRGIVEAKINKPFMSIDEYKQHKIDLCKADLETFLKEHPLISACKDGIYKEYNVTLEKQNLFAGQFAVYQANKANGIDDIFKWNESGKSCVEWTDEECLTWMNDTRNYTQPLVAAQQSYEEILMSLTTIQDVVSLCIDFSMVDTVNGKPEWLGKTVDEVNKD